ncbi:MAG TPA: hypothetical protein VH373_01395 [Jatrophihabitantaceae bacterium]|jgi:polyphosphate kinase
MSASNDPVAAGFGARFGRRQVAGARVRRVGRAEVDRDGLDGLVRTLTLAADDCAAPFERVRLLAEFSQQLDTILARDVAADPLGRRLLHNLLQVLCTERDGVLEDVLPALAAEGVQIIGWDQTSAADRKQLRALFDKVVYPLVTPLAVDATHPFPYIPAMALHVAALVRDCETRQQRFACVPLPDQLFGMHPFRSGLVRLDAERLVGIDAIVGAFLELLFPGVQVMERSTFRLVRAVGAMSALVPLHRLEIEDTTSARLADILRRSLDVADEAVYRTRAPLGLAERIVAAYEGRAQEEGGRDD